MKSTKILFVFLLGLLVITGSCSDDNDTTTAPELPPAETVLITFDDFTGAHSRDALGKSDSKVNLSSYDYSKLVIGIWNTGIVTTLAVPIAAFRTAFAHQPEFLGNSKWEWTYTVDGFGGAYIARLTGEISGNQVNWEMFVERTGIDAFDEFLWFSGVSHTDAKSGYWVLNHSAEFQEDVLRIDWEIEGEEIGNIKYTYVRALNDDRETDLFKDSYIIYGLQAGDLDAFYDVHAYDFNMEDFADTNIEWSRATYNGRVMAPHVFEDTMWHCWDTNGDDDANCPQ